MTDRLDPSRVIARDLAGQVYRDLLGRHVILIDALRALDAQLAALPRTVALSRARVLIAATLKADAEAAAIFANTKEPPQP